MSVLENSATYQGFECKDVHYRRSEGLVPELGSVTIDYRVLNVLELKSAAVPWRAADGSADGPGAMSIHVWFQFFGSRPQSTRTAARPPAGAPGAGLRLFGDLVLRTQFEGGAAETTTYTDVFVENAEEVSENLAHAREHKEGEIRIDLTDLRRYYPSYGAIINRINCRLDNGKYDPRTIKKAPGARRGGSTVTSQEVDGEPWSFEEVMRFLFSQLPGTPAVLGFQTIGKLPPPEQIDRVGSAPVDVIQDVLTNFGLVAKMMPGGDYLLARPGADFLKPGEIAPGPGDRRAVANIAYETKSVGRRDVPPVVMVLGGRRYRRETIPLCPVFTDIDGRIYRLVDIEKVWSGYSIEQVCRQAAHEQSLNFEDVPPRPFFRTFKAEDFKRILDSERGTPGTTAGKDQDDLHYARRDIMRRQAFRMYAPEAFFDSLAPRNAKGAPYFSSASERVFDFLPIGPYPILESQLKEPIPGRKLRGDKGNVVIVPPTVRGITIQESLWDNEAEVIANVKKSIEGARSEIRAIEREKDFKIDELRNLDGKFDRADRDSAFAGQLESELLRDVGGAGAGGWNPRGYFERGVRDMAAANIERERLKIEIDVLLARMKAAAERVKSWTAQLDHIVRVVAQTGGVQAIAQVPWGEIPSNAYSLDPSTGIVSFSEIVAALDWLMGFAQSDFKVIGDGGVVLTFGHALNYNEVSDWTSILFMRGKNGKVRACGANRSSAVKPRVIHDPDMVMLEDSNGEPLNLKDCIQQAERKAKPKLEGPESHVGFSTTFSGFLPCVLERGVNSVQHTWDGNVAHTFVAVNAPWAAGLEGPVKERPK